MGRGYISEHPPHSAPPDPFRNSSATTSLPRALLNVLHFSPPLPRGRIWARPHVAGQNTVCLCLAQRIHEGRRADKVCPRDVILAILARDIPPLTGLFADIKACRDELYGLQHSPPSSIETLLVGQHERLRFSRRPLRIGQPRVRAHHLPGEFIRVLAPSAGVFTYTCSLP